MDLRFTADEIAFRDEVRTFMRTALPAPIRRKMVKRGGSKKMTSSPGSVFSTPRAGRCRTGRWHGAGPAGAR